MEATHRNAARKRVPSGALGMLVLIAAVEAIVAGHELDLVTTYDWQYLQAGRDAVRRVEDCELLILGDSQLKFGVIPSVVGNRFGARVHNLAIGGAQAPATFELLRLAYQSGARPSAIVVDFAPFLFANPPSVTRAHLPFLLGYSASLELAWSAREPVLVLHLAARRALFSLRCRSTLRSWLVSSLAGRPHRDRSVLRETLRHWAQNAGAMVMPAIPGLADPALLVSRFYPKGWVPDRTNVRYLHALLELAAAHGTTVYWLIPPMHPAVEAANEVSGFDKRFIDFVTAEQRRHPRLVVIDGRHAGYDPNVFYDADHVGREGAFVLSEDLGDLVRTTRWKNLPPNRWVKLPRYHARPPDPAIIAVRHDAFFR